MMKTVMILPPQAAAPLWGANLVTGFVSSVAGLNVENLLKGVMSIFVDLQAKMVEVDMPRHVVEHQVPGREGGIIQDMGARSTRFTIAGKWIYENRPDNDIMDIIPSISLLGQGSGFGWNWLRLQMMQMIYRLKTPLVIACDLIVTMATIENMNFKYSGGKPNVYDYTLKFVEYNPLFTLLGAGVAGLMASTVGTGGEGMGH